MADLINFIKQNYHLLPPAHQAELIRRLPRSKRRLIKFGKLDPFKALN